MFARSASNPDCLPASEISSSSSVSVFLVSLVRSERGFSEKAFPAS
jgi:hypothetical protein